MLSWNEMTYYGVEAFGCGSFKGLYILEIELRLLQKLYFMRVCHAAYNIELQIRCERVAGLQ